MALKKYNKLYTGETAVEHKRDNSKLDNKKVKQEVEQLKEIINSKIKDPQMAKKAAEILKNWGLRD